MCPAQREASVCGISASCVSACQQSWARGTNWCLQVLALDPEWVGPVVWIMCSILMHEEAFPRSSCQTLNLAGSQNPPSAQLTSHACHPNCHGCSMRLHGCHSPCGHVP
eukprot:365423-Chlamydomonas_euryale.AAC.5